MKVWECIFQYRLGQPSDDPSFPKIMTQSVKIVDSEDKAKNFVKYPSVIVMGKEISLEGYCGIPCYIEREVE